jgi:hypothetical protein
MSALAESVLARARSLPEGVPVVAKEFLGLGTRAAVDQTLSRLAKGGRLLRAGRGLYLVPVETRFGLRAPTASLVADSVAELRGESVAPSGAAEANKLGLTTQVPVREVYLTSGRTRWLKVGAQELELRHAPAWQLLFPTGRAGQALRVLGWVGQKHARENLEAIRRNLGEEELEQLARAMGRLPSWVAEQVHAMTRG